MSQEETDELVNPDKRIIQQVTVKDVSVADCLFDDLMGTAILPRKQYIKEHSAEAKYML